LNKEYSLTGGGGITVITMQMAHGPGDNSAFNPVSNWCSDEGPAQESVPPEPERRDLQQQGSVHAIFLTKCSVFKKNC
jgi:hypothetical protein